MGYGSGVAMGTLQMWLGSGVAVAVVEAGSCSSNLTPSPGTSKCHGDRCREVGLGEPDTLFMLTLKSNEKLQ